MKQKLMGVFAWVVMGCGAVSEARLPEPGRPFTFEEVYSEPEPELVLIDQLDHEGQTILFHESPEDGVVVTQIFPVGSADLLSRLRASREEAVTPAELWRYVTQSEAVPDPLVRDHERIASLLGRSADYLPVTALAIEVDKAIDVNSVMRQSFFPRKAGQCWQGAIAKRGYNNALCGNPGDCPQRMPAKHVCSGPGQSALIKGGDNIGIGACSTALNDVGTWRVGTYNDTEGPARLHTFPLLRLCSGTGDPFRNGSWSCASQINLNPAFFVVSDFTAATVAGAGRVSHGVANPMGTGDLLYAFVMGTAKLINQAPVGDFGFCTL